MLLIILYCLAGLVGLVVLLLLIAALRAVAIKSRKPRPAAPPVDAALAQGYAEHLSAMLQYKTVNEQGGDPDEIHKTFVAFHKQLQKMFPLTFKTTERAKDIGDVLLLRWPGKDPARGAVVVMAHSDVVPATGDWKYPPYSGEIAEGAIWGRGAMDTKGSLCAIFEAVEGLIAEGFVPPCDVYISSANDEETMDSDGAAQAVQYLLDRGVKLDLVSDEGGAVVQAPIAGAEALFAMMGITEKGYANVLFTAKSLGGHASSPPKGTPLARLSAFICDVEKKSPFKSVLSGPMRDMLSGMAPHMSFSLRMVLGNLWLFGPIVKRLLPSINPMLGAMLRTTIAFTMAKASDAPNVIPAEASVVGNMRFIMHQRMDESIDIIRKVAARYDIETSVLYANDASPYVDMESERFRYVRSCVEAVFPDAVALPYIMVGGTDSRYFAPHCPCTVRFNPTVLNKQQLNSMHAIDENLDVASLARAVQFYTHLLRYYQ